MSNLVAEKLIRSGKRGDRKTIRDTYSVYDKTLKTKLVKKGMATQEEAEDCVKEYLKTNTGSFMIIVREITDLEVIQVT